MGISFSHRSSGRGPMVSESKARALGVATNDAIPSDASIDAGTAKVVSPKPVMPTKKLASTSGGAGSGSAMGNMQLGATALNIDLDPLMTGFDYNTSDIHLYDIYRDMYFFDPVPGGIVDLFSTLPFSPYTFGGAKDAILEPFYEVNERLKLGSLLPRFAVDHLVTGTHVSSLIFDQKKKQFLDLMTYRMDNIMATPIPFLSEDPILELRVPEDLRKALDHPSQRIAKLKERFGAEFIEKFSNDTVELDQLGTIYFPRKSFSYEEGTSYFRRILPLWLIEKNLYRGTLIESGRRQRGILQIQMGDGGEWEPSVEEMEFMTDLVLAADADPIGSVITTRLGVNMSEFRCFAGRGSLVHTENGLVEMSSLVEHDPAALDSDSVFKINIKIKSLGGLFKTAKYLHYRGFGSVYKTTTVSGTEFRTTVDHKFLTVDGSASVVVKPVCDIHRDSGYLLLENKGLTYDKTLALNLTRIVKDRVDNKLVMPKYMTPELAYLLGIIVSEGYISKNGVEICNTDTDMLDKVVSCVYSVFSKHVAYTKSRDAGVRTIRGKEYDCKDLYRLYINGRVLVGWLDQLGLVVGSSLDVDTAPCYEYQIPWSILQADTASRFAFIAAYLDGDGSVVDKSNATNDTVECKIYSQSRILIQQFKVMLADMGYKSRVEYCTETNKSRLYIAPSEAHALYNQVSVYMACSRKTKFDSCSNTKQMKYGIPAEVWLPSLMDRKVGSGPKGVRFLNDDGVEIVIAGFGTLFRHITHASTVLNYNIYAAGGYTKHLDMIKSISSALYNNLVYLLESGYTFERIADFVEDGEDHLYDISMSRAEGTLPSFVVNGGLVKNSGGDLWKVTDIWDQTSQMKMKALGVSESFLSDTTYDNQNTGLNVFMEYMRSFRDQMTRQIFYEKIFPIVSMMHGYTVNRNGKVVISNMIKGDYHEIMNRMRDGSRIFIPQVHWAKQMHPEVNQSALDSLRAMQELGIPPALRAVAAAGGFNLDQLLADADENIAIERRVMEYKKRMGDLRKRYGLGDDQEASMSANSKSMLEALSGTLPKSGVLGNMAMPKLRTRNFDPEIVGTSRTGKKKYIHNQSQANDKANRNIMKAMETLSRSRNNPLTHGSTTSFSPTEMDISNLRRF